MSNFTFLESHWGDLAKLGDLSEKYVYSDPNTSIIKQGMLSEVMVKYMLAYDGIAEPEYDNTHSNRIRLLKNNDLLPREIDNTLYILRKARNDAAHNEADEGEKALNNLQLVYELCVWYMQTYGDYTYEPVDYVTPVDITISIADLEKENAELEARNQQLLVEIQQIQQNGKADSNRRAIAYQKALNVKLTEAQTRELMDEQLRKVGWEVDTKELRYSKRTRPTKGKNIAIAEWPTDSSTGNNGYADYALFIGEKMVGIIEARKKHTNISFVLDGQCKDYAKHIKAEHQNYVIKAYGQYLVPFLFATNGREYIKQYEDMSGIWFLDTRESFNAPKALSGWPSPEGIEQDLERDIAEADKTLASTGYELLEDPNGLNLRYYQIEAIKAAEKAIADKQRVVLLAMATGTGKTRTVLGMIYRFLSAKSKDGLELKKFYEELLRTLGEDCTGRIQEIYNGARSNIEEPANLKKIITNIDGLDWYSAKEEGLGNFYEGLLEKNANEKKSGAGQYFTHRVALPVYSESGSIERYNIVRIEMLIRHASDDKLYLYDMVNIKKETGNPFQQYALR